MGVGGIPGPARHSVRQYVSGLCVATLGLCAAVAGAAAFLVALAGRVGELYAQASTDAETGQGAE